MLLQFSVPFALSLLWVLLLCPTVIYNAASKRVMHFIKKKKIKQWRENRVKSHDTKFKKIWSPVKSALSSLGFLDIFHNEINLNFLKAKIMVSFESTYVISTYYALASLSSMDLGGKKVLFMAPYFEITTGCIILGALGLTFLSIIFPLFLFVKLKGFGSRNDEDPGSFGEKNVHEKYGWLYSRFRVGKWNIQFLGFLHRFLQILVTVFIRDPGMALNVSFVLNLFFGLVVGLQHPKVALALNALEYLTMFASVSTILCGMWFNWLNVARDGFTSTSRYYHML